MINPDTIEIRPCIEDASGYITSGPEIAEVDAMFFGVYMRLTEGEHKGFSVHIRDFITRIEAEAFADEITGGIEDVFCCAV